MLVVDASAIADLVLNTARGQGVRTALADDTLHAPSLLPIEVASVLRSLLRQGSVDRPTAARALDELDQVGIEHYEPSPLLPRALELSDVLTVYDAVYVALAEGLGATLVTCDGRLARAPSLRCEIALVE
jgi:predicted nucleic acid-binding protein